MEEICLCHSELWEDRLDMLEHQVSFYRKVAVTNRIKAELFRTALAWAGGWEFGHIHTVFITSLMYI